MLREVLEVAGGQVPRGTCDSDFEKRFVVGVGKALGEWNSRRFIRCCFDVINQRRNGILIEVEPRPAQHVVVLRENAGIDTQDECTGNDHPHDHAGWAEGSEQSRDKDVGIEDDPHFLRASRTALISASMSAALSLPVFDAAARRCSEASASIARARLKAASDSSRLDSLTA